MNQCSVIDAIISGQRWRSRSRTSSSTYLSSCIRSPLALNFLKVAGANPIKLAASHLLMKTKSWGWLVAFDIGYPYFVHGKTWRNHLRVWEFHWKVNQWILLVRSVYLRAINWCRGIVTTHQMSIALFGVFSELISSTCQILGSVGRLLTIPRMVPKQRF